MRHFFFWFHRRAASTAYRECCAVSSGGSHSSVGVAAACVWVQAEFKLGRLSDFQGDFARLLGAVGDPPPMNPDVHTAHDGPALEVRLLWAKLRLAMDDPDADAEVERGVLAMFEAARESSLSSLKRKGSRGRRAPGSSGHNNHAEGAAVRRCRLTSG